MARPLFLIVAIYMVIFLPPSSSPIHGSISGRGTGILNFINMQKPEFISVLHMLGFNFFVG
jgi:hypothetical protein